MKLTFLGTRGNTEVRTELHYMHSSLMVHTAQGRLMLDCGLDWLGRLDEVRPDAIAITHAHPDHAWGLREGAPCPVYAGLDTWAALPDYPLDRRQVTAGAPAAVLGATLEAFPLEHSIRAPAVGYRVGVDGRALFYAPDLVYIRERGQALAGVSLYVGDGATIARSMVRKRGDTLIGHTPVRTQLTWCAKEAVPRAVFTHCGTGIITAEPEEVAETVAALGRQRGVEAVVACDGMEMALE